MNRAAFSLLEIVISVSLVAFCLLVFLSVASTSLREGTRTRSEILADEAVMNTYEEIQGSHFGDPNHWWKDGAGNPNNVDIVVVLEGRQVATRFTRQVEVAKEHGGTGAFFGRKQAEYDVLKISLSWTEGTGLSSAGANKTKTSYLTVWKRPGGR